MLVRPCQLGVICRSTSEYLPSQHMSPARAAARLRPQPRAVAACPWRCARPRDNVRPLEAQAEPHTRHHIQVTGRACSGAARRWHPGAVQVDVYNNMGDLWRAQGTVGRNEAQRCYGQALQVCGPARAAAPPLALTGSVASLCTLAHCSKCARARGRPSAGACRVSSLRPGPARRRRGRRVQRRAAHNALRAAAGQQRLCARLARPGRPAARGGRLRVLRRVLPGAGG